MPPAKPPSRPSDSPPTVNANGLRFAYLERGEGPLVLCLHGFPDTAHTWAAQLDALAAAGYRAVAPFMRGYAPTQAPRDDDYAPRRLGEDAVALVEALGHERAVLVGHDWGAIATYLAANLAPQRFSKVVTAAVPHPRAIRPSLAQARRSWYMAFFQLQGFADRRVARDDFAFVDRLWRAWSPGWRYTDADVRPVKDCLGAPGGVDAALGYYRSAFRSGGDREARRLLVRRVRQPARTFAGVDDGCMGVELLERSARFFGDDFELIRIEGAGHFMHRERPDEFNHALLDFLGPAR